ncbi:acyltransferase family protein [Plesiomonas shigelloides]|uniref:acyltransferase family protein n=1 Tax=Plesiomonas shigelloides TaxID=703 RepID=UPI00387F18A1
MGYFRLILAILVCANHLWIIGGVGRYAVFSFYILSGYLMTTIICTRYGVTRNGVIKYALNRVLRIYPTYLIVFLFTILAISWIGGEHTKAIDPNISIPQGAINWIMNISLIGLDFNVINRTVPPSWTLFIELFFYAFIPLAIKLGPRFIIAWLIFSIAYHAHFFFEPYSIGYSWNERYGSLLAGSLGFALGCSAKTILHNTLRFKNSLSLSIIGLIACYSIPTYYTLTGYNDSNWNFISSAGFYLNMIFSTIFISNIINHKQNAANKFLGELSYPLYLCHLPVGFVVINTFNLVPRTIPSLIISLIFSIAASLALYSVEKKINSIRDIIRPQEKTSIMQ